MSIKLFIVTYALVIGMKAYAADLRIPTQQLQEVLEGKSTRTSRNDAYTKLHARLIEIAGQIDESTEDRLKLKNQTEKEKFANIVLSLSLFLGCSDRASSISTDYDRHIRLINLVKPYVLNHFIERSLNFSEARLLRLRLKSKMRNHGLTVGEADPGNLERGYIWTLLNYNSNANTPKTFLYEKAYLVAHYEYFPTEDKAGDCRNALELLKDFISPRKSPNKSPRTEILEIFDEPAVPIIVPVEQAAEAPILPVERSDKIKTPSVPKIQRKEKEDAKQLIKILKKMMREAGTALSESSDSISGSDEASENDEDNEDAEPARAVSVFAATSSARVIPSATRRDLQPASRSYPITPLISPAEGHSGSIFLAPFSPATAVSPTAAAAPAAARPRIAWGARLRREPRKPVAAEAEKFDSLEVISSEVDDRNDSSSMLIDSSVGNAQESLLLYPKTAAQQFSSESEDENDDSENDDEVIEKKRKHITSPDEPFEHSDSEIDRAASSSSSLSRQEKDQLIAQVYEQLGPREEWTQDWTQQRIAEMAGSGIQKWDAANYVRRHNPELKRYNRLDQTEQEITDKRIRKALEAEDRRIEGNPGAKRLKREEIAAQLSEDITQPQVTVAMIAHYIDRRGADLKGRRAQEAEDRRSRIAEALAQNDEDVAKGKRPKTYVQIAADAGEDINTGMVMHYVTEFDTRPKQPQKPIAAKLTDEQKEQIEKLLSDDITMEHKDVAEIVKCKPTQVSKYVDRNARHLKSVRLNIMHVALLRRLKPQMKELKN